MKKISIIIPHYNSDKYIEATLESIEAQSFKNIEVIVIDDGSDAKSVSSLKEILGRHSDLNIEAFFQEKNGGPSAARNFGFSQSSGDYIVFLDADDLLCGKFSLEYRYLFLERNPQFSAVAGYSQKIDQDAKILNPKGKVNEDFVQASLNPGSLPSLYCKYLLDHSTEWAVVLFLIGGNCFLRRDAMLPFDSAFNGEEDIEWTLRLLRKFAVKLEMVPFYLRRSHPGQLHLQTKKSTFLAIQELANGLLRDIETGMR